MSSGRSILVAPRRSPARRGSIRTSAWLLKPLAAVSGPCPCTSGSHSPRAVGVVLRDVERAVVEQVAIGRCGCARSTVPRGDELVDVVETLVVAGIDDVAAVPVDDAGGALMLHAAERRALLRRRGGVERIDFHDPAEAVGFVRLLAHVEAIVPLAPCVPVAGDADSACSSSPPDGRRRPCPRSSRENSPRR